MGTIWLLMVMSMESFLLLSYTETALAHTLPLAIAVTNPPALMDASPVTGTILQFTF